MADKFDGVKAGDKVRITYVDTVVDNYGNSIVTENPAWPGATEWKAEEVESIEVVSD